MTSCAIEFARFFSTIGKIETGNKCQVWKAQIETDSGRLVEAFIKHLPPREMFIECITAQLGRDLGISIPHPFLVRIFPAHLPELKLAESTIVFGSQDAKYPSLQQFTCTDKAIDELRRWPDLVKAGCFDEWIANSDRHHGNILYSGNGTFSLIDHSHAIPKNHAPNRPNSRNSFLEIAQHRTTDANTWERIKNADNHISTFVTSMNNDWEALTNASSYISPSGSEVIKEFLQSRLTHLSALVRQQLNMRQGELYAASA